MLIKIFISGVILLSFFSCGKGEKNVEDMNDFISKYDLEDFSYFQNYKIVIRQRTFSKTIYFICEPDSTSFIFSVSINNFTKECVEIKRGKKTENEYFKSLNKDRIKQMLMVFRKYNFKYLSVDKENNVSINPYNVDMKPFFLRLNDKSKNEIVKKDMTVFKIYKENWYIREY